MYFMYFQHPYLYPVEFATINDTCGISIHKFEEKGTLRDVICKVWYDNAWDWDPGFVFRWETFCPVPIWNWSSCQLPLAHV